MELLTIQKDIIINPEYIVSIDRQVDYAKNNKPQRSYVQVNMVGGLTYTVDVPTTEFLSALSKFGVDLTKQYFAV